MTLERYADIYVQKIGEDRYAVHFCYNLQEKIEEMTDEEGNPVEKTVYECEAFGEIVKYISETSLKSEYKRIGEMYDLPIVGNPQILLME